MPHSTADFATAIKGKKTLSSVRNAIDTEIARAKIEASSTADHIELNLKAIPADYAFLFADLQSIATKAPEDFGYLVKTRVAEHQAKEAARLENERARIRAEEAVKAAAESARQMVEPVKEQTKAEPVAIKKEKPGRMTAEEMRCRINRCLDNLNDHQLLNVLAYVEGHFIAHAA